MTQPHRVIIQALMDKLIAGVPELAGATQYLEEPVRHDSNGTHIAVWFEGDTVLERFNTTGDQAMSDLYGIRYWQPAPERPRKVVNEDKASDIESIMDAVRAVIFANQEGIGTAYDTRYSGGRKFIGRDDTPKGGMVSGFEVAVTCRRAIVFT
jgi:hypothetical protein